MTLRMSLLALASTIEIYGDGLDIAKYGEISILAPGHVATPIDRLMPNDLGEKLTHEATRLLDPEANWEGMPDAYWDQALIQDEKKYAGFVDKLLFAGLFEICLKIRKEVGLLSCYK